MDLDKGNQGVGSGTSDAAEAQGSLRTAPVKGKVEG